MSDSSQDFLLKTIWRSAGATWSIINPFSAERRSELITCFIRYTLDAEKLSDFEQYARVWMRLIEKYGGTHHGYFIPHEAPPAASFSFAGIGEDGPRDVAVALFSFPTIEAYEKYRREVKDDPECQAETRHFHETKCFTKYERTFLQPVAREIKSVRSLTVREG